MRPRCCFGSFPLPNIKENHVNHTITEHLAMRRFSGTGYRINPLDAFQIHLIQVTVSNGNQFVFKIIDYFGEIKTLIYPVALR